MKHRTTKELQDAVKSGLRKCRRTAIKIGGRGKKKARRDAKYGA